MASLRKSSNSRSRIEPGSRPPPPKMGALIEPPRDASPLNSDRIGLPPNPQFRLQQSRLPQTSSSRKPSVSSSNPNHSRPPLVHETQSWSSTADRDLRNGQPRNVLRRKQSSISKDAANLRNKSRSNSERTDSSSSIPRSQGSLEIGASPLDRTMTASPIEMQVAQKVEYPQAAVQPTRIYPELDRYREIQPPLVALEDQNIDFPYRLATEDLPPPTPLFSGASSHSQLSTFSASPSTRFSESPGPGPYSRDTTPTSMSSQSPGLVVPMRLPPSKMRQPSPAETRPPVTRRRAGSISNEADPYSTEPHGLAAVREALTSSSSSSTVRTEEKREMSKRRGLSPALEPPPRKSSQKFNKDQKDRENEQSPARNPQQPNEEVDPAASSPSKRPSVPSRPSRDGAPDLYVQLGGSCPVVHSNLSSTSVGERRQSGQLAPSSLPRSTASSTTSLDRPMASKLPTSREPTPAPRPSVSTESQRNKKADAPKAGRTPSPNVSTFRSRFPIFGRRHKNTAPETSNAEKNDRSVRKGPAAGTGHEGYGRIGAVKRRSGSSSSRVLPGPVSSSESLASNQSTDSFLLERMNPVIIAGGAIVENRNTSSDLARTESNQSMAFSRPSFDSRNNSAVSLSSREESRNTLWPSAMPRNANSSQSRRPSDSSDSEAVEMKPTIAFRRSRQRLRSPDNAPFNMPKPILTHGVSSPPLDSIETTILTDDSYPDSRPEPIWDNKGPAAGPKKLTKRAKSPRRWNLFGRAQNKSTTSLEPKPEPKVSAAVQPVQTKPMAFYTMMDSSEQEDNDDQEEHDVVTRAAFLMPESAMEPRRHRPSDASLSREQRLAELAKPKTVSRERRPSTSSQTGATKPPATLKPSSQLRRPSTSSQTRGRSTSIARPSQNTTGPAKRGESRSRAPPAQTQTGKEIQDEPVAAKQPTATTSGARPSRLPQVGRIPKVVNSRPDRTSPQSFSRPFNRTSLQLPPSEPAPVDNSSIAKGPSPPTSMVPDVAPQDTAEMAPRKDSACTVSSSSSGYANFANHTAVQPHPSEPLQEDEVWDEYNDLIGGDAPPSPTSSRGLPFCLETYETRLANKATLKPLESPTVNPAVNPAVDAKASAQLRESIAATSSSHHSADMTARINAAFRFSTASTTFSCNEEIPGDDDCSQITEPPAPEPSVPIPAVPSQTSKYPPPVADKQTKRDSESSRSSDDSPLAQVNLRVGSMTVSKWLTFGHVLFSPVRDELVNKVGSLERQSILVIDGLGNDDWSFYAAETYPAATFFNLSPRAPISQDRRASGSFPMSPPNHHQIQFNAHTQKFPFGAESFTAVVFRFPTAAPESHYRNIISEARRVLKPGGYIELSILDADLHNVGNRTRRAVRKLKERITMGNPDFNLSSSSDVLLRQLGQKGFADLKTCRVGVPVASAIAKAKVQGKKDERSLAEMMSDDTEVGDENITNMVSKVGRWWFNRCYELPAGMPKSIWNDRSLLSECHEWGTSLKLTVCHARIPEGRGGRVQSL